MKNFVLFSLGILCMIALMSFSFPNKKKKKKQAAPPAMQYIPSGILLDKDENNETKEISMPGYFMMEVEVTNSFYKEFLADLEKNGRDEDLRIAQIQNDKWNEGVEDSYMEPIAKTYHNHEAYADYPVVNVSRAAAELYCEWLTQKWNERTEKEKPKGWDMEIEYRLPTKNEWMYAARGRYKLVPYPWGGYYLRNGKGQVLANFRRIGENNIKFNRKTGEYEVLQGLKVSHGTKAMDGSTHLTAPARSYVPNDNGLYNMSGNVTEMLHEEGTKGGSWGSTGYYLQIDAEDEFPDLNGEASKFVGFRPVAVIKSRGSSK